VIPYWLQLIAGTGITAIVVYGSIFDIPRDWLKSKSCILKEFLSCSLCVGFWSGFVMSHFINDTLVQHVVVGFAVSATSWLYDSVVGANQAREVFLTKKIQENK
jgi:hypothetical protein